MLNLIFKVKFIMNLINFVAIEIKLDTEKNHNYINSNCRIKLQETLIVLKTIPLFKSTKLITPLN